MPDRLDCVVVAASPRIGWNKYGTPTPEQPANGRHQNGKQCRAEYPRDVSRAGTCPRPCDTLVEVPHADEPIGIRVPPIRELDQPS
jgi:hypothetical protein